MRKIICLLIMILILTIGCAQADEFIGESMKIDLPAEWIDVSYLFDDGSATFMNDEACLNINPVDMHELLDEEEFASLWNMMNDEMRLVILTAVLEENTDAESIDTPVTSIATQNNISACYYTEMEEGVSSALAYALCGDEVWIIYYLPASAEDMLAILDLITPVGAETQSEAPASDAAETQSEAPASDAAETQSEAPASDAAETQSEVPASDAVETQSEAPASDAAETQSEAPASDAEEDAYAIPEVPMVVHLDESSMNIFTTDTPADSISLTRTTFEKDKLDTYVFFAGASLLITHSDDASLDYGIQIRVKDNKYPDLTSWNEADESEIDSFLKEMFGDTLSEYELYRTDNGVYAVFALSFDTNALRYMTIHNGDVIYIHGKRENGAMTEADLELLKTVTDSVEFT